MKVALIGGGTIARLAFEHIARGELGDVRVVGILGRSSQSRGVALAGEFNVPFCTDIRDLLACEPDVVVEAASHDAVRAYGEPCLRAGTTLMVLSGGALADDALRQRLEAAATSGRGLLYVPSGGIGGLDALQAACVAGADSVSITVAKPPAAWKNIAYVEQLGIDLESLREAAVLYEGPARGGVPLFPANVNIAAVLAMAGIGFDRTRMKVVADPAISRNTHTIEVDGPSGHFTVQLQNVPAPENPKTAWLACYSALAALKRLASRARYGT